ncbi:MAG: PDZ domain-containing protein [Nitrospirae bacterium]|nr:PDZ domain-containing protein [Nitrospirota bacterium]
MNGFWKQANYFLIIAIIGTAAYLLIFNPGKLVKRDGWEEGMVRNVQQNAQTPEIVAWQNGNGAQSQAQNQPQNQPQGLDAQNAAAPYDLYANPDGSPAVGEQAAVARQVDPQAGVNNAAANTGVNAGANTGVTPGVTPQTPSTQTGAPNANKANATGLLEKVLQEGHWIGLEVVPLTPAIATANNVPPEVKGVLVDEVTLLAAYSGMLAGDVITGINGAAVTDLATFKAATRPVAMSKDATVAVFRNGSTVKIPIKGTEELGLAQMEAAQMILPTAVSPHGYYGACNRCHAIARTAKNTGQLAKDAGDVLAVAAPPIKWGVQAPHRDRGKCMNCHKII